MKIRRLGEQWLQGGGLWLTRRSSGRIAVIVCSVLFAVLSLVLSDRLVSKIAIEEHEKLEMWANATRAANAYDQQMIMTYLYRILDSNTAIPIIMTDDKGNILSYYNIDVPRKDGEAYLRRELERYKRGYPPIVIDELVAPQYIYCSDSYALRYLVIFPDIQLRFFLLFLGIAIVSFFSLK